MNIGGAFPGPGQRVVVEDCILTSTIKGVRMSADFSIYVEVIAQISAAEEKLKSLDRSNTNAQADLLKDICGCETLLNSCISRKCFHLALNYCKLDFHDYNRSIQNLFRRIRTLQEAVIQLRLDVRTETCNRDSLQTRTVDFITSMMRKLDNTRKNIDLFKEGKLWYSEERFEISSEKVGTLLALYGKYRRLSVEGVQKIADQNMTNELENSVIRLQEATRVCDVELPFYEQLRAVFDQSTAHQDTVDEAYRGAQTSYERILELKTICDADRMEEERSLVDNLVLFTAETVRFNEHFEAVRNVVNPIMFEQCHALKQMSVWRDEVNEYSLKEDEIRRTTQADTGDAAQIRNDQVDWMTKCDRIEDRMSTMILEMKDTTSAVGVTAAILNSLNADVCVLLFDAYAILQRITLSTQVAKDDQIWNDQETTINYLLLCHGACERFSELCWIEEMVTSKRRFEATTMANLRSRTVNQSFHGFIDENGLFSVLSEFLEVPPPDVHTFFETHYIPQPEANRFHPVTPLYAYVWKKMHISERSTMGIIQNYGLLQPEHISLDYISAEFGEDNSVTQAFGTFMKYREVLTTKKFVRSLFRTRFPWSKLRQ